MGLFPSHLVKIAKKSTVESSKLEMWIYQIAIKSYRRLSRALWVYQVRLWTNVGSLFYVHALT